MKKIKFLVFVLLMSLVFVACSKNSKVKTDMIKEVEQKQEKKDDKKSEVSKKEEPQKVVKNAEYLAKNGSLYMDKNGNLVPTTEVAKYSKIIEWYFEPACPGCIYLESDLAPILSEIMGDKTLINYHPISFLGKISNNKQNIKTYSDVAGSMLLSIAKKDPANFNKFLVKIMNYKFVSSIDIKTEGKLNKKTEELEKVYKEIAGDKNLSEIKKEINTSFKLLQKATLDFSQNKEIISRTKKGSLSVPLLYSKVDKKIVDLLELGKNIKTKDDMIKSLREVFK